VTRARLEECRQAQGAKRHRKISYMFFSFKAVYYWPRLSFDAAHIGAVSVQKALEERCWRAFLRARARRRAVGPPGRFAWFVGGPRYVSTERGRGVGLLRCANLVPLS